MCAEGHDRTIVHNNPLNFIDPLGLEEYGNVEPEEGWLEECSSEANECWEACMKESKANYIAAVMGVSGSTITSVPKLYGSGALGSSDWTSGVSMAQDFVNLFRKEPVEFMREFGRSAYGVGNGVTAGAFGLYAGLAAACSETCNLK